MSDAPRPDGAITFRQATEALGAALVISQAAIISALDRAGAVKQADVLEILRRQQAVHSDPRVEYLANEVMQALVQTLSLSTDTGSGRA